MKAAKKISYCLAGLLVFTGLSQTGAMADEGANSYQNAGVTKEETFATPDGGTMTVTQKAATAADFPVIPDVGEVITLHYADKDVRVETLAAGCTTSYTAYTPRKEDNKIKSGFGASMSSGCSNSISISGQVRRTNYGGGYVTEGSHRTTLSPGINKAFTGVTGICQTGNNASWHSNLEGSLSSQITLPCNFNF